MAEIRISAGDLKKLDLVTRNLSAEVKKLDARAMEKIGADVAGKINANVKRVLADVERLQARFGLDPNSEGGRRLRTGLEVVEGGTGAVDAAAPFIALLSGNPQVRIALLAATGIAGALEGLSREHMRRVALEAEKAAQQVRRAEERWLKNARDVEERIKDAMRAAGRPR
jgi:hypothetical protein